MKYICTLLSLFMVLQFSLAQQGWRDNEMEVRIELSDKEQKDRLALLKLNGDIYSDFGLVYVTPQELKKIERSGLRYEITKADLNNYYRDFWLTRDAYHNYQEIIDLMDSLATHFPDICIKFEYGLSLGNRELSALKISDNASSDEAEAEVMFDGGIHGDEIGGPENCIRFARDLCLDYGNDPDITELINNREIWIYPLVNPDGRVSMTRYNMAGVDLNRDWGYMWDAWGGSGGAYGEPESKALLECVLQNQFNIHVTFHSGIEYFLYPWYYRPGLSPDDAANSFLGQLYTTVSGYPNLPSGHAYNSLYPTNGTSGEAYYGVMGSYGFTMEISYNKQPPASQIMYYYNANLPSMIEMIRYAGYGINGTVTDSLTGEPVAAVVFIDDLMPFYTDPEVGDYHKFLIAGTYDVKVVANGYKTKVVEDVTVTDLAAATVNFELAIDSSRFAYRFCSSQIPDNNYADEGNTPAALGAPDNINYSIGKYGWCVLDMQETVFDGPGNDILVHEGDASPEGFTCYGSSNIHGPWDELGTGNGTSSFDLAMAGIAGARYFKVVDDGDGTANANDAGFDLDAIEVMENISGIYIALYDYYIDDQQSGNGNGRIDPGETADIKVTLRNNGDVTAVGVIGTLTVASPYIIIVDGDADFGDIGQNEISEGTFTVEAEPATPNGTPAEIGLMVSSNSGTYTNNFIMDFMIGQIPVLVVDLDENHNSGSHMHTAIQANGISSEITTQFPQEPELYTSIFVCLGIYNNNYVLSPAEGQALSEYLNNGGMLYMEGGDTWYYDNQTAVHPMFNINATNDGSSDLGTIMGQTDAFTEGMSFNYSGENNWIDHIEPISPAFKIFQNQSPAYGTGIACDAGAYKTIGCSHEFGGLDDGSSPSTKEELMHEYLGFFGLLPDNVQANFYAEETGLCEEDTAQFQDYSTGNIVSWSWYFPGGNPEQSNLQNPAVYYEAEGLYDVSLVVSDGTVTDSISKENYIEVFPLPEVDFDTLPLFCLGDPPYLLTEGSPAGGTYSGPGIHNGYFYPDSAGIGLHTLLYSYTNPSGCTDQAVATALVDECTRIGELPAERIEIFPNPARDLVFIRVFIPGEHHVNAGIYDLRGKLIRKLLDSHSASGWVRAEWNPADSEPGVYVCRIRFDNSDGIIRKVIILR